MVGSANQSNVHCWLQPRTRDCIGRNAPVQANPNREGGQRWKAAGQGVDLGLLVEASHLHLSLILRPSLVLLLDGLHLRLNGLHGHGRLHLPPVAVPVSALVRNWKDNAEAGEMLTLTLLSVYDDDAH